MELEQYHLRIPKYLIDRVRSEVVERWGYEVKGGIGLIINEVLEEKFRTEKVGTHTHIPCRDHTTKETETNNSKEKNELAVAATNPTELRISHCINMMIPDIYQYATKPRENNSTSTIGIGFLHKIISKNFHVYDKRSIKRYVDMLVTKGIISDPELNKYNKVVQYAVNLTNNIIEVKN
jgi:hypothetical protein